MKVSKQYTLLIYYKVHQILLAYAHNELCNVLYVHINEQALPMRARFFVEVLLFVVASLSLGQLSYQTTIKNHR